LALSCNVATDRLVYEDVRGLSTTETCSKAWIWGCIKPKDAGMLSYPVLVTSPPVCGDKTTPTRNDCIAWLRLIVGSWVQVPARVDLRRTDYIQWGQAS
jgi:hypothetical protein